MWSGRAIRTSVPLHELYYRQHGYRLIDPRQRALPRDPREISPTDLLQAKYEILPYVDVTLMKGDLLAWCRDGSRATAGRLVHGPGGVGKTRLMIAVAAALGRDGWTAGFLDSAHDRTDAALNQREQALDQLIAYGEDNGLLVVLDYAEGRQQDIKKIVEQINGRQDGDARPVRLVLLARSAGEWWTALHDETPDVQRLFRRDPLNADVRALAALPEGGPRRELFHDSVKTFGPTLAAQGYAISQSPPSSDVLARIETEAGHSPLAVQMQALLWLMSAGSDDGAATIEVLLQRVLSLERAHWGKLLGTLDDAQVRDMARGAAQVTVVQGTGSSTSSERLLIADRFYGGQRTARVHVDPVIRNLQRIYGTPDGGLSQIEPDLIGEHHVATIGDVDMLEGCLEWIESGPADTRQRHRRHLLTVLQRATHREHGAKAEQASALLGHLSQKHLTSLAREMVAVIIETPGAMAALLERRIDAFDEATLAAIGEVLPVQSLALMEVSLRVALRRVTVARTRVAAQWWIPLRWRSPVDLRQLADQLNTLGVRLVSLGRSEEALAASQEAVDVCRRLARRQPAAFLPDLATSLNTSSTALAELGRHKEALEASREVLAIRQRLARSRPGALLDLAVSMNTLSNRLVRVGRREEALTAAMEVHTFYSRFAQQDPGFLPNLARNLNDCGNILSDLGRHNEALAATQRALEHFRHLAQEQPDAFLPEVAMSLGNLGICLVNVGRREEALAASQEAVAIYRRLAERRREAFLPNLARSLNNLGADLGDLRRHEEAIAATEEAVDIYRHLMERSSDAVLPALATTLSTHSEVLAGAQRHAEAAAAVHDALTMTAALAERDLQEFGDVARERRQVLPFRVREGRHRARHGAARTDCADGWRRRQHRPNGLRQERRISDDVLRALRCARRLRKRWRPVVHLLTARQHDGPHQRCGGSVLEAIPDDRDDVTGRQGLLGPAAFRHELRARAADPPVFDAAVGVDIHRDRHMRIGPGDGRHGTV